MPQLIQLMSHDSPRVSQPAAALVSILCPGDVQVFVRVRVRVRVRVSVRVRVRLRVRVNQVYLT